MRVGYNLLIKGFHLLGDQLLLESSDLRSDALAILEEMEGGEVLNAVVGRELFQTLVRRIHRGEGHILARSSQLVVEGSDYLALSTPGSVEIDHQILGRLDELAEVLLVLHLNDIAAHQLLLLSSFRSARAEELGTTILGVDGLFTGLPVGRTHLTVLGHKLEGLHETENLIHTTTDGEVVHGDLLNHSLGVDDEQSTKSNASFRHKHSVLGSKLLGNISNHRDLHISKTTSLTRSLDPSEMGLNRVGRASNQLGVELGELLSSVIKGNNLSRAESAEILGVEEENDVLS